MGRREKSFKMPTVRALAASCSTERETAYICTNSEIIRGIRVTNMHKPSTKKRTRTIRTGW